MLKRAEKLLQHLEDNAGAFVMAPYSFQAADEDGAAVRDE